MTMAIPFPHPLPTETEVDDHGHTIPWLGKSEVPSFLRKVKPEGHGQVTYTPLGKGGR